MSNAQSIEFQDLNKDVSEPMSVRRSFRVPVDVSDNIHAVICKKRYQVRDISCDGISIPCNGRNTFMVAQIFENCLLETPVGKIQNLTGKIVHLSNNDGDEWLNGVQWIEPEPAARQKIADLVAALKEKLFKTDATSGGDSRNAK